MELHVDDDAFVRAPVAVVYPRLTDVAGWPDWWPGADVESAAGADGEERWRVRLAPPRRRRLELVVRPHAWRHDAGFRLDLAGDLEGWSEFWLEEGWSGTVVHHVMVASTGRRRPHRVLTAYRASLRRGFWGLKDLLHAEARHRLEREPRDVRRAAP